MPPLHSLTSSVECYDPRTDAWTRLPDLPIPLARSSAVVFDSHVLLIGGETVSEDAKSPVATEKVYRYDLTTHTCKLFLVLPEPRHSAASIVLDNYLYILGGVLHSEATRSVLRINLSKCAEAFAKAIHSFHSFATLRASSTPSHRSQRIQRRVCCHGLHFRLLQRPTAARLRFLRPWPLDAIAYFSRGEAL